MIIAFFKHLKTKISSRTRKAVVILSFLLPYLTCFVVSCSFSQVGVIRREYYSDLMCHFAKSNDYSNLFLNFDVFEEQSGKNFSRQAFLSNWRDNFIYSTQFLCLSSEDNVKDEATSFGLYNNSFNISNSIRIVDACLYSTQSETLRFETLKMNVYKFRERSDETNVKNCDGFIYVPDFIADLIIEKSNGILNSYDDLLIDGDIPSALEDYLLLKINYLNQVKTFRIANVFHVLGYNDIFVRGDSDVHILNDDDTGLIMRDFIGDFCVAYCYDFTKENNYRIYSSINSKKFFIYDYLNYMSGDNKYTVKGKFYTVENGKVNVVSGSEKVFECFDEKISSDIGVFIFCLFSIILHLISLFFVFFNNFFLTEFKSQKKVSVIRCSIIIAVSLIVQILGMFFITPYLSKALGLSLLSIFVVELIFFIFTFFKGVKI